MRAYGIIKRFDDLGRILIPKEVRIDLYGTSDTGGKPMEIYYDKKGSWVKTTFREGMLTTYKVYKMLLLFGFIPLFISIDGK